MASKKVLSMADKLVKKVNLELDGDTWPLMVTHNVIIDAEDALGQNGNILSGECNIIRPSAKVVRALLWAALKRAGAKYSLEDVGELITPHNIVTVQEAILTAWAASMPEVEEDSAENPTSAVGK
jgi:hypothetical protein